MTKLSIIILSFNTHELIKNCIDSLEKFYKKELEDYIFEIILVDNASDSITRDAIKDMNGKKYIKIIENKENYGFSKGNNIGVAAAKGKYILFLNSDTQMQDSNLSNMLSYMEKHEDIGIVGAKLQNSDGTFQSSAGVFYTLPRVFLLLIGGERFGKLRYSPEKVEDVDWISGAMMLIEKNLFEKLGGFDEKIFMYMEDMELCYRMKKMKKRVVFYANCIVQHISHGSSNRSFAIVQIYKGLLYFYKKHTNRIEYSIVKGLLLVKAVFLIIFGTILGKKTMAQTYTKALAVIL